MLLAHQQVNSWADAGKMPSVLLVSGSAITRGVAGLVAGRLAESFHRPAVAISVENDFVVGSGRSIPEFDIFEAFNSCQDLFVRFGGHSQAAGFTLAREKLPLLEERLNAVAERTLNSREARPGLDIDGEVRLDDLDDNALGWLSTLEPFGAGNPRPIFLTRRARVAEARYVGKTGQHVRLKLVGGQQRWTALAFNQAERWVDGTATVDLVYSLSKDHWRGQEQLTLKVLDFQPVDG